jgi:hypothetical protein
MPFLKGAGALIARARRAEGRDRDAIFGIGLRGSPWTRSGRHDIRAAADAHAFDQGEPLKRFLPRLASGASRAGVTTAGNEPSRPVPMSLLYLFAVRAGAGAGAISLNGVVPPLLHARPPRPAARVMAPAGPIASRTLARQRDQKGGAGAAASDAGRRLGAKQTCPDPKSGLIFSCR